MRVAYCLYGQPRRFKEGYNNIMNFLKKTPDITFDFFYHTWFDKNLKNYECSPWRYIIEEELKVDLDIIENLNELYKPVSHFYEPPINFDTSSLTDTIIYKNSNQWLINPVNNLLSQIHTRQAVRNLLDNYIKETGIKYDLVITSRFDFLKEIHINLNHIDSSKLYTSRILQPRHLITESFLITNVDMFIKIFYNMMSNEIIDNKSLEKIINQYNENVNLTMESVFFTNFLHKFKSLESVVYTDLIPNFI